jgi:hypothetical protein
MSLGHSLVKGLALCRRNIELQLGGLARAVTGRECTCTPGGAAVDFFEVGEHGWFVSENEVHTGVVNVHTEGSLVSQRDVDEAVMR